MSTNATPPEPDPLNEHKPPNDIAARKLAAGLPNMRDPLFEKFEQIHRLQGGQNIHEADTMYAIGAHVAEVLADGNTYGIRAVPSLSHAIGIKSTALREYAHVAQTWNPDRFAALMERRDRRGLPISFYHLTEIRRVTDPLEREKWVNDTLAQGWSIRQLRVEMQEDADQPVTEPEQEPDDDDVDNAAQVETPVTLRSSIVRMRSVIRQIPDSRAAWQDRIFAPLGDSPAQFGRAVLDDLAQARTVCGESLQALHDLIAQLDDAILAGREAVVAVEGGDDNGE